MNLSLNSNWLLTTLIKYGCLPPQIVFPVLTHFRFKGASEYLEDLVAHIDSPQLDKIEIT